MSRNSRKKFLKKQQQKKKRGQSQPRKLTPEQIVALKRAVTFSKIWEKHPNRTVIDKNICRGHKNG